MKRGSLRSVLLSSAAATMLIASAGTANAIEYNFGSVQFFFDTTLSAGASLRTASTNTAFLPTSNGGPTTDTADTAILGVPLITGTGGALTTNEGTGDVNAYAPKIAGSINTDDGRLNFDRGDLIGNTYKMTNDIQAKWENYTFFARVNSYYDAVLDSNSSFDRSDLVDGKADAARDIRLLDLYLTADYNIGDFPVTIRAGKQAINWGESTFLLNGVNGSMPIDVNAFRRPGAEVKEGFIPIWAIDASIGLPYNLSLEAFYQLEQEEYQLDRPGTPFSTSDSVLVGSGVGGNENAVAFFTGSPGSAILRNCSNPNAISAMFDAAYNVSGNNLRDCGANALDFGLFDATQIGGSNAWINQPGTTESIRLAYGESVIVRDKDRFAGDSGQYGIAARWYSEDLNNTEFGFYYTNTHSRLPIASERISVDSSTIEVGTFNAASTTGGQQGRLLNYNSCNAAAGATAVVVDPVAGVYGVPLGVAAGVSVATLNYLNDTVVSDPDGVYAAALAYADQFYAGTLPAGTITPPAGSVFAAGIEGTNIGGINGMTSNGGAVQANSLLALTIVNCALVAQQSADVGVKQLVDGAEILFASSPQSEGSIGLFLEYPEDIRMYGFSFNTTLGTWGVQGDFTYRPNQPVQLDTDQLTINALRRGCVFEQISGVVVGSAFGASDTFSSAGCGSVADGSSANISGVERTDIYTAQAGTTATFTNSNPLIGLVGADLGILVTEVGMMYAPDAPNEGAAVATRRWANVCSGGGTDLPLAGALGLATRSGCRPTTTSWGYVLLGQLQYNSVFGTGFALQPTVALSHGVKGNSPAPLSNYREGAKSVSLQLNGTYLGNWRGGISYTNFFGNEKYAGNTDQDFVSMNVSYSF